MKLPTWLRRLFGAKPEKTRPPFARRPCERCGKDVAHSKAGPWKHHDAQGMTCGETEGRT